MRLPLLLVAVVLGAPAAAADPCAPADGVIRLHQVEGELRVPRLSPDGRTVAFEVEDDLGIGTDLLSLEGRKTVRRLRPSRMAQDLLYREGDPRGASAQLSWSQPDCTYPYAYTTGGGIYVSGWSALIDEGRNVAPTWSPTTCRFIFVSSRTGRGDLYLWDDGQELQMTFDEVHSDVDPAWSPEGGRIAFVRAGERSTLMVLDVATYSSRAIFTPGPMLRQPSFSPDGSQIAVFREGALLVVEATPGARPRVLTADGVVPPWFGGAPWTADGAVLAVQERVDDRARLLAWAPDGSVEDLKVGTCGIRDPDRRTTPAGTTLVWVADGEAPGTRALYARISP